jgi:hypothetical protein
MQVHGGGDGLAGDEALEAGLAADRQRRQAGAALAQRPFEQRIVAMIGAGSGGVRPSGRDTLAASQ